MSVTFSCSRCQHTSTSELVAGQASVSCAACGVEFAAPPDTWVHGKLTRCLVCPSQDLFMRRDFPQRLGVAIVVLGFVASSVAWLYYYTILTFAILFATALVDVVLYVLVPGVLVCYRCGAHYRGIEPCGEHGAFELATHERYRQQAARLAEHRAAAGPPAAQS